MSETSKQEDWNEQEALSQIEELLGDGNMEDVIKQNIVAEGKDYFDKIISDSIYENLNRGVIK